MHPAIVMAILIAGVGTGGMIFCMGAQFGRRYGRAEAAGQDGEPPSGSSTRPPRVVRDGVSRPVRREDFDIR